MSLSTKSLAYDVNTSTASYFTGGTIQSKNNTLSSRAGSYHSPSKTLSFRYDVKLKNPEYTMACDTLQYNTISRTAYFTGPTTITGDSTIIRTEQGWYSTVQENCRLTKKSEIISGKQILKGDTIIYERRRGYGLAIGNVLLTDTSGESEIQAGKAEYWENAGLSILSGSPLMAQYFEKDTLYLCADTLYSWHEAKSGERILRAYYRCKLFKRDLQGICDSIVYKTEDSLMTLYHSPVLWSSDCQLSSKKIIVKTGKKRILGFELQENAFVTQLADSNSFNQISGRTINGICKNDKITDIFVKGNAQSLYFLKEKQKVIGMNKTECSEMRIKMAGNGIDQITFIKKPVSSILPLTDLTESDKKLKGFVWRTEKKPTSVSDLRN
jgi:lipopolysaccharide export system protein LptA